MITIIFLLNSKPPYVMLNRIVLSNCGIETEDNFSLESIVTCSGKQSDLLMYITVNTAFMHYFDSLADTLDAHVMQNWATHEQILPISLHTFDFNSELLEAPKTLKDLVYQYNQKKEILDTHEDQNDKISKHSFFINY